MGCISLMALLVLGLAHQAMGGDDPCDFTAGKGVRSKGDAQRLARQGTPKDEGARLSKCWKEFKAKFCKNYKKQPTLPGELTEAQAYANFQQNIANILRINSDPNMPFWTTSNFYADSQPVVNNQAGTGSGPGTGAGGGVPGNFTPIPTGTIPRRRLLENAPVSESERAARRRLQGTSVDWRPVGEAPPRKDKYRCGSCWWKGDGGVAVESPYEYAQRLCRTQGLDCQATGDAVGLAAARLGGVTIYPSTNSESALMAAVAKQPTVIYFEVVGDFYSYSGGTYTPSSCGTNINHAMVAVGYSYTGTPSTSHWIVRNSWGACWGVNSYAYIQMSGTSQGPCGMYTNVVSPPTGVASTP